MKTIYLTGLLFGFTLLSAPESQAAWFHHDRPNPKFRSQRSHHGPSRIVRFFLNALPIPANERMAQDQRYFQDSAPKVVQTRQPVRKPEATPFASSHSQAQTLRTGAARIPDSPRNLNPRDSEERAVQPPRDLLPVSGIQRRIVRTTAYTHSETDHQEYGRFTAMGTMLRASRQHNSAAADWSRYPVGTIFRIVGENTIYVIEDYGSALVGTNTIDIYRPSRSAMNKWGVRNVEIEILRMGSFDQSRVILAGRLNHPCCEKMHRELARFQLAEAVSPFTVGAR